MVTHSSILPGESPGQRSLAGYSPWGRKSWIAYEGGYIKAPASEEASTASFYFQSMDFITDLISVFSPSHPTCC